LVKVECRARTTPGHDALKLWELGVLCSKTELRIGVSTPDTILQVPTAVVVKEIHFSQLCQQYVRDGNRDVMAACPADHVDRDFGLAAPKHVIDQFSDHGAWRYFRVGEVFQKAYVVVAQKKLATPIGV
jgi:hypothetical protein